MTDADREELEQLAGEYVLGTLESPYRERFETRLASDPELRRLVEGWQFRLGSLVEMLPGELPPANVWAQIERATAAPEVSGAAFVRPREAVLSRRLGLWWCIGFWRWLALGACAATIALAAYLGTMPQDGKATLIAVLNDANANPVYLINADPSAGRIAARPVGAAPSDGALELWVITGGDPPRSLGLLAHGAPTRREIPTDVARALRQGATLAVSREPAGGSPTGRPTGPVLYQGRLLAGDL